MTSKSIKKQPVITKKEQDSPLRKDKSFVFRDIVNVVKSTGSKASTLAELRDGINAASDNCIFHHTYQFFLRGHITEHTNDFAQWAGESLEESALAERLSNIDPYSFSTTKDLKKEILAVLDAYAQGYPEPRPDLPGHEFFFSESVSFVFPAGLKARNLAEMLMAIKYLDSSSLYYHFFEARTRLRKKDGDFSKWITEVVKAPELSARLGNIDPFMSTLEGIREQLILILEEGRRKDMVVSI